MNDSWKLSPETRFLRKPVRNLHIPDTAPASLYTATGRANRENVERLPKVFPPWGGNHASEASQGAATFLSL